MEKMINYVGSEIVKLCKWITLISATVSGVFGIVMHFYTIPYSHTLITAGSCISAVAMFIVGNAKGVKDSQE